MLADSCETPASPSSMILPRQSPGPMQWYEAMRLMPELGATCAVQMPPGHALAALVAGSAPSMYALALEDDGIERAVAQARRFSCTDACPGAVEVTNQPAAERLASKRLGSSVSANARLINMVRSGVLDISQASITAFSLDDASEAVTRAADQSAPFDRTVITPNRK